MSVIAAAVRHLLAAGVTGEALVAAIEDMEAAMPVAAGVDTQAERRREADRQRKREARGSVRTYRKSADIADIPQTSADIADAVSLVPLSPPKENIKPPLIPQSHPESVPARAVEKSNASDGFAEFWKIYPRKTAKAAAEKAWPKACRRCDADAIIAAAKRFADDPPDPEFTPHPATWLNQARFEDEEPQHGRSPAPRQSGPCGTPRQRAADDILDGVARERERLLGYA